MKTVRQIVCERMKRLDLGPYDVAKMVTGKMTPQTVYNFVNGRGEMTTERLGHVLAALGLEIVAAPDSNRTPKRSTNPRTAGSRRKQTGRN